MSWNFKTDQDLRDAGYIYESRRRCYGQNCKQEIEMWRTPAGNLIPIDPGTMQPHWASCPDRDRFRK